MLRLRNIRITERLVLNFILIGIGSILIVSSFSFYRMRTSLLERAFEQLTDIRVIKKNNIERFFSDRLSDVQLLASSNEVHSMNFDHIIKEQSSTKKIIEPGSYLYRYIFSSGYYDGILFSDYEKTLHIHDSSSNKNLQNAEILFNEDIQGFDDLHSHFKKSKDPIVLDYTKLNENDDYHLFVVSPIMEREESNIGFVALQIPLSSINQIITQASKEGGFGESGETYLVGPDFKMRSKSRFVEASVMKTIVQSIGVKQAYAKGEGIEVINDYRNIKVLSSFSTLNIKGLDWVLLSEIDFSEVLEPIIKVRDELLIISSLISFLVFIIAWLLAKRITKPILQLRDATKKLTEGTFPNIELTQEIDEIRELIITFNEMSASLFDKQEQLQTERQKQLTAMIDGQENERRRLSLDIHDGLGQQLVAIKYRLESIDFPIDQKYITLINNLKSEISDAISEAKLMSNNLMPATLEEFGLITALKQLCSRTENTVAPSVFFESNGTFAEIDNRTAVYLFRITQEALSNAMRHANASTINVQISELKDSYLLLIEDDGTGFEAIQSKDSKGRGLIHIRERTTALKGVVEFQSKMGIGTIIHVRIPKS